MEDQIDKIKVNDSTEPWSQIMKQFVQISVGGDRFRNLQESREALAKNLRLMGLNVQIVHESKLYFNCVLSSRHGEMHKPKKENSRNVDELSKQFIRFFNLLTQFPGLPILNSPYDVCGHSTR